MELLTITFCPFQYQSKDKAGVVIRYRFQVIQKSDCIYKNMFEEEQILIKWTNRPMFYFAVLFVRLFVRFIWDRSVPHFLICLFFPNKVYSHQRMHFGS